MKKHSKHPKIARRSGGKYPPNEYSIIGAPCDIIDQMAAKLIRLLNPNHATAYLNAAHDDSKMNGDYQATLIDKISHYHFEIEKNERSSIRKYFNNSEILLVNGNHFLANKQIVLIHEKKKESLSRKLDRLHNVQMIVSDNGAEGIYGFVKDHLKDLQNIPIVSFSEIEKISALISQQCATNKATLKGLILSGGQSQRMGTDKSMIDYHGQPQTIHEASLLKDLGLETFISTKDDAQNKFGLDFNCIPDSFQGLGPFGGILSAFRHDPNAAWLSLACDLPYLNKETISQLIAARDVSKVATCFYNPETDFPEPLITIWEPRAYAEMLDFLSQGYACPRKVLINSDINMINMKDVTAMRNVNNPEEKAAFFSS